MASARPEQRRALEGSGRPALRADREADEEIRRLRRRRRRLAQHLPRRDLLPARRLGLRQDDAAAHDGGLRAADRGPDLDRRRGRHGDAALRTPGQHDVPVLRALPAHVRAEERRLRAEAGQAAEQRGRRPGRGDPEARPHGAVRGAHAAPALGRPAPARRARPRARQAPEAPAARRAARRARPQAARAHAVRAAEHPGDAWRHLRRRDARPGGGDDARLTDRRHEPRRDHPDRHAVRHLRVPELALRRRLHRIGEHVRGPADRGRAGLRARRLQRARRHLPRRSRRERRAGRDRLGRLCGRRRSSSRASGPTAAGTTASRASSPRSPIAATSPSTSCGSPAAVRCG